MVQCGRRCMIIQGVCADERMLYWWEDMAYMVMTIGGGGQVSSCHRGGQRCSVRTRLASGWRVVRHGSSLIPVKENDEGRVHNLSNGWFRGDSWPLVFVPLHVQYARMRYRLNARFSTEFYFSITSFATSCAFTSGNQFMHQRSSALFCKATIWIME